MDHPQDEERVRVAHDGVGGTYAHHFRATEPEAPLDLAMIEHFVALLPHEPQVLDAGCGPGRKFPFLADRGCQVEGVDLSPRMIDAARGRHPEFPSHVGSLTNLPASDESYDGFFSWYSTIHCSDTGLRRAVAEARRVLRPDGVALFAFQAGHGTRDVSASYRRHGHDVTLVRHNRTTDEMVSLPRWAGLGPHHLDGAGGGPRDGSPSRGHRPSLTIRGVMRGRRVDTEVAFFGEFTPNERLHRAHQVTRSAL